MSLPPAAVREQSGHSLGRRFAAGVLTLSAVIGAQTVAPGNYATLAAGEASTEHVVYPPTRSEWADAADPSKKSIAAVTALVQQPENPRIAARDTITAGMLLTETYFGPTAESAKKTDEWRENYATFLVYDAAAAKHNLHVFNNANTLDKLDERGDQPRLSGEAFVETANEYLRQHNGLEIAADPSADYGTEAKAVDIASLPDNPKLKAAIIGIVQSFGEKPREYTEMLDIKRILLIEQKDPDNRDAAMGYIQPGFAWDKEHAFVMNITFMDELQRRGADTAEYVTDHELAHRIHYLLEGNDMYDDTSFIKAIGNLPYGKAGPAPEKDEPDTRKTKGELAGYLTVDEFAVQRQAIIGETLANSIRNGTCVEQAPAIDAEIVALGNKVRYPSWYPRETTAVEHVPELMTNRPEVYSKMLDQNLPHINKQFIYQLARLYEAAPEIASYFVDIAAMPETNKHGGSPKETERDYAAKRCAFYATHAIFGKEWGYIDKPSDNMFGPPIPQATKASH